MNIDRQQLLDDGFVIVSPVIASDRLDDMRDGYETLIERKGGQKWLAADGSQPRLETTPLIDEATANTVEIWLDENTLGVARQLLCKPDAAVTDMCMMCSPLKDHGPSYWHRDIPPALLGPLHNLQMDVEENGPRYLQWNIALHDDDVLWVVPGSHRRLNTKAENEHLQSKPLEPLPGAIPVKLRSGDGVVYNNYLLHWGSNYSVVRRRTLHGGHSLFSYYPDLSFVQFLSPSAQHTFERWQEQGLRNMDLTESALRAAIERDGAAYRAVLGELQPGIGEAGQMVFSMYLSKTACCIRVRRGPALDGVPEQRRKTFGQMHAITLNWGPKFADRFTGEEAHAIWERFGPLDARLRSDTEQFTPGFQSGPMEYYFQRMPEEFGIEAFIASWR